MATNVIMPKQGLQMTEGKIISWLINKGQSVKAGEPLLEIETDKLTMTIDAPESGVLLEILCPQGEVAPVAAVIAVIGAEGEVVQASAETAVEQKPQVEESKSKELGADEYDVAVIGGGPGGYIAAIRSAQLGNKTIIVEKSHMGGTCLNRGCVPTKSLLHSAEIYQTVLEAANYGIDTKNTKFDYSVMAQDKDDTVKKLRAGIEGLMRKNKILLVKGEALVKSSDSFTVDGKAYSAKNLILATGSKPRMLPIPGADLKGVLSSDEVLELKKCPKSITIIGGGVIGIEFATLFNKLGSKVTVIEMLPKILGNTDDDACDLMRGILEKQGVEIHTNAKMQKIEKGLTCTYEKDGKEHSVKSELVLMSVGRAPVTETINIPGLNMDRGIINVDAHMRTNIKNVYAIGDITGKIQLAHVASMQGIVAAHNISGESKVMDYIKVPSCIYTTPEIASVGMTEAEAKQKHDVNVGFYSVVGNAKCLIERQTDGFVKIITDKKTDEIYGACIVAPRATDMIGEIAVAMQAEATIEEVADTIHAHPTIHEIIVEAAHDVHSLCCHK